MNLIIRAIKIHIRFILSLIILAKYIIVMNNLIDLINYSIKWLNWIDLINYLI